MMININIILIQLQFVSGMLGSICKNSGTIVMYRDVCHSHVTVMLNFSQTPLKTITRYLHHYHSPVILKKRAYPRNVRMFCILNKISVLKKESVWISLTSIQIIKCIC